MAGSKLLRRIALFNIPLGVAMILLLFPFYWMLLTSFKSDPELYNVRLNPLLLHHPSLGQLRQLFMQTQYVRWLWNTMFIAVFSTLISLIASRSRNTLTGSSLSLKPANSPCAFRRYRSVTSTISCEN